MTQAMPDDLWRDFPKTATEFEARFATEEDSFSQQASPPFLSELGDGERSGSLAR